MHVLKQALQPKVKLLVQKPPSAPNPGSEPVPPPASRVVSWGADHVLRTGAWSCVPTSSMVSLSFIALSSRDCVCRTGTAGRCREETGGGSLASLVGRQRQ